MYTNTSRASPTPNRVRETCKSGAGRYLSSLSGHGTPAWWLVAVGTLGALTVHVVEQRSGTADWATSQMRPRVGPDSTHTQLKPALGLNDTVRHIRTVLGVSATELSRLFGVSRQTIHEWIKGGAVSPDNGKKLEKIALLADVLTKANIEISPFILRRPLTSGKTLLETALTADDVVAVTSKAVQILVKEARQRELISGRLVARSSRPENLQRYISLSLVESN